VAFSRHPALIEILQLTRDHWQSMRRHVDACAPLEACGLLAGRGMSIEVVLVMHNQAQSPTRFVLDPREQLLAFDSIESQGLDLLGVFHSHPAGPETVSATDIAEAAYPVVHVVWSRPHGEWGARGFWIEDRLAVEVTLQVV